MNIKKLKDALSISFQIQLLIERITLLPLNYTRYIVDYGINGTLCQGQPFDKKANSPLLNQMEKVHDTEPLVLLLRSLAFTLGFRQPLWSVKKSFLTMLIAPEPNVFILIRILFYGYDYNNNYLLCKDVSVSDC